MLDQFLTALPNFLIYFAAAIALMAAFLVVYINITPYQEISLIRANNMAAAVSLAGSLLGFALPIANVIAHSDTLLDLALWGLVAGVVQLVAYRIARLTLPQLDQDIPAGRMAPAIFLATLSITVGLLNAACLSY